MVRWIESATGRDRQHTAVLLEHVCFARVRVTEHALAVGGRTAVGELAGVDPLVGHESGELTEALLARQV